MWFEELHLNGSGWEWQQTLDRVSFSDWADPNWQPDSLSNTTMEYCAMLSREKDWAWAEQDCFKRQGMVSVCEIQPAYQQCFQNSCYQLISQFTYYDKLSSKCASLGGTVLEINSKEESDFIKGYLDAAPVGRDGLGNLSLTQVWLGATDIGSEGNFRWMSNNSKLNFDNWGMGQPNNGLPYGLEENCVVLESSEGWKWKDVTCDASRLVVCEVEKWNGGSRRR
ncbi:C-type mannose receptor 2-like [Elysia marginata]|uniref:C-type mannose receptor 2-like n=1 Tax=Elysia marginata TaxID=1093978 RepID=A0AAV4G6V4_9GAST|nr:C-type mannose receptor 2-like [Elysia marginata]